MPDRALNADWLLKVFGRAATDPLFPQWAPELRADRREAVLSPGQQLIPASVLVPVVGREQPSLVLTRRTTHLSAHAGQISFPGGRAEPDDPDAPSTALREAHEEIGLQPEHVKVLGVLPSYHTVTGFAVTPVIAWLPALPAFRPDPTEVADIFCVPLAFLMNPENHQLRVIEPHQSPGGERIRFYAMPYSSPAHQGQEFFIWGATASIIRNFYHFLSAAYLQSTTDRPTAP